MRGVVRRTALALVAATALVALAVGVAATCFGCTFLVVRSGSMAPALSTGALAVARPVPVSQVRPGDVVSVPTASGQRVTHRLVSATPRDGGTSLVLRGDANASPDAETYPVPSGADVDRVVASVPVAGYVVAPLLTPPGLVAGGAVLLMLVVALSGDGRRRAGVAVVAALAVVGATVGVAQTAGTWAYFTDSGTYQSGQLSAGTLAPPTGVACTGTGAGTYITWSAPSRADGYSITYTWTNGLQSGSGGPDTVTGSPLRYRPPAGGLILSRTFTVTVAATYGSWTSAGVTSSSKITVTPGGAASCG